MQIGDEICAVVAEQLSGQAWALKVEGLSTWSCTLRLRAAQQFTIGTSIRAWVLEIDTQGHRMSASVDEFGRLPVSDRMRPRYVAAIRHTLALLSGSIVEASPAEVSEMKGMLNRCLRRDQWDWATVYAALGSPHLGELRQAALLLSDMRNSAARDGQEVQSKLDQLRTLNLHTALERALVVFDQSSPKLRSGRRIKPRTTPSEAAVSSSPVLSEYSRHKLEDATRRHEEALRTLVARLEVAGYRVEANVFIDAFCHLKSGPALFEVKSTTASNELGQVRQAVSQLYEYRFRHSLPQASLWILLTEQPREGWLVDYLERDRGISLLWLENGAIGGPSAERLFESGSAARRRLHSPPEA